MPPKPKEPPQFNPLAGLAAFAFPGLGHFLFGDRRRGIFAATGVLGLFFGGILIGGIDVIDRQEAKFWFIGQALVGPMAFGIDHIHQTQFKVIERDTGGVIQRRAALPSEGRDAGGAPRPLQPGEKPPNIRSLAKVNEIGTLFSTIGGMLNLIIILDAMIPIRRRRTDDPAAPAAPAPMPVPTQPPLVAAASPSGDA
jgi:hypothetical protein